jgi:hypothetical protein
MSEDDIRILECCREIKRTIRDSIENPEKENENRIKSSTQFAILEQLIRYQANKEYFEEKTDLKGKER